MKALRLFTIYDSPADFPGRYVVREFGIVAGGDDPAPDPEPIFVGPDLEAARLAVRQKRTCASIAVRVMNRASSRRGCSRRRPRQPTRRRRPRRKGVKGRGGRRGL